MTLHARVGLSCHRPPEPPLQLIHANRRITTGQRQTSLSFVSSPLLLFLLLCPHLAMFLQWKHPWMTWNRSVAILLRKYGRTLTAITSSISKGCSTLAVNKNQNQNQSERRRHPSIMQGYHKHSRSDNVPRKETWRCTTFHPTLLSHCCVCALLPASDRRLRE